VGPSNLTSTNDPSALATLFRDIATLIGERLTVTYTTPKASGTHTLAVTIAYGNRSGGFELSFTLP
jgi:hypothetical protein